MGEKLELMKKAAIEDIINDKNYFKRRMSLSNTLKVTKAFGIKKEETFDKGKIQIYVIYGYEVKNIGNIPISCQIGVWNQNEDGVYVEKSKEVTLYRDDTAILDRKHLAILTCNPEFSFTLENGRIMHGYSLYGIEKKSIIADRFNYNARDKKYVFNNGAFMVVSDIPIKSIKIKLRFGKTVNTKIDAELDSHYFEFNWCEKVYSDEVFESILDEGEDRVKDTYIEAFGFLENEISSLIGGTEGNRKLSTQEVLAAYVRKLLNT